jgi:hypothetical protein
MKILITGRQGLSQELAKVYSDHDTHCVSRSTGYNITEIANWARDFLDFDLVFNCAYDGRGQEQVLEHFFQHWQHQPDRCIVSIGSRIITQPRSEILQDHMYWPYRQHKQNLQNMHDHMLATALCDLKIINPGPFNSAMSMHIAATKMNIIDLAHRIRKVVEDPTIKRIDLWL